MIRALGVAVFSLALPVAALANALVDSVKGQVTRAGKAVTQGQRLDVGSDPIVTGPNSQVTLRFDDGLRIAIGQESSFRLVDYRFTTGFDRVVLDLTKGAARMVTGSIVGANEFALRVPQATLLARSPSDFTVALVNPAYLSITQGSVSVSNGWGSIITFSSGSTAVVPSSTGMATTIPPGSLPAAASGPIGSLRMVALGAPGGPAGGAAASATGTAGGISTGTALAIGAVAAGVAAAAGGGGGGGTTTTTHH